MFSCLTPASRFLGSPLHAADYFIDILNTDIFRKHSASDSPGSVFHILLHFLCRAGEDVADFLYGWRREENKANRERRIGPNGLYEKRESPTNTDFSRVHQTESGLKLPHRAELSGDEEAQAEIKLGE